MDTEKLCWFNWRVNLIFSPKNGKSKFEEFINCKFFSSSPWVIIDSVDNFAIFVQILLVVLAVLHAKKHVERAVNPQEIG